MIKILEGATIVAFITAPIIAYLNLRAMRSEEVPITHRPSQKMIIFCYTGLVAMISFSIFYLVDLL
jgi:Mn2+/Fe2+ NRAMP family transporter